MERVRYRIIQTLIGKRSYTLLLTLVILAMAPSNNVNTATDRYGGLCITTWNSRGLSASVPYLKELMRTSDVICLSEHWLHANRLNRLEEISDDFNVIARASVHSGASKYGITRGQGGVAILWRKSLGGISPMSQITHDRICGIRAQTNSGFILNIYSIYMPAPGCCDDFEITLDEVAEIINTGENGTCTLLCGDFNADMGYLGGKRSTRKPTKVGRTLDKFLNELDLVAINMTNITRGPLNTFNGGVGSSTIDYITIPKCMYNLVLRCEVLGDEIINTSDHFAVRCSLEVECAEAKGTCNVSPTRIKWDRVKKDTILTLYTNNVEDFARDVRINRNVHNLSSEQVDELIDNLVNTMVGVGDNLPKSKYKPNVRPYWNERLQQLKNIKVENFRKWVAIGRPKDENSPEWIAHKGSKKSFRKELKFIQREYEKHELESILTSAENDKNKFWRFIKRSRKAPKSNSHAVKNKEGVVVHDIESVVNVWRNHFKELSTEKHEVRFDANQYTMVTETVKQLCAEDDNQMFLEEPISRKEIRFAIKKLNKGKAAGYDQLTAEHLQHAGRHVDDLLAELFNRFIELEHVPSNFKIGTQIPLYKGKNTCSLDPNNYRGITLLTSLNKAQRALYVQCTYIVRTLYQPYVQCTYIVRTVPAGSIRNRYVV